MSLPDPSRKRDLAQIHIAVGQLNMADDVYRALIRKVSDGQTESSGELNAAQRQAVLKHLRSCGYKPAPPRKAAPGRGQAEKRPTPAPENAGMVKRIRAQLISLGRLPNTYADGISKQAFGVDYYEWLTGDQLWKLSAMLAAEQQRQGADTGPALRRPAAAKRAA